MKSPKGSRAHKNTKKAKAEKPSVSKRSKVEKSTEKVQEEKKRGREPEYDEKLCCSVAKQILEMAGTEQDVANALGVSRKAIYNWKKKHPEFAQVVELGKGIVDSEMVRTLANLGLGKIKITEQRAIKVKTKAGESVEVVNLTRNVPPDVTAIKMWLFNRRPEEFREKQVIEHEGEITQTQVQLYQPDLRNAPESFRNFLESCKARKPEPPAAQEQDE